jgi:hypothetical protein
MFMVVFLLVGDHGIGRRRRLPPTYYAHRSVSVRYRTDFASAGALTCSPARGRIDVETDDRTDDAPQGESPSREGTSREGTIETPAALLYFPPWMRDELILHFRGSDGVTTDEAKRQIEAYERNFMAVFGGAAGGSGPVSSASETVEEPATKS